jgi:hypothetical protein
MNTNPLTAILLLLIPMMFNVVFYLLQRAFDYPDILRRPTSEVFTRFHEGGSRFVGLWYAFVLASGVLKWQPTIFLRCPCRLSRQNYGQRSCLALSPSAGLEIPCHEVCVRFYASEQNKSR